MLSFPPLSEALRLREVSHLTEVEGQGGSDHGRHLEGLLWLCEVREGGKEWSWRLGSRGKRELISWRVDGDRVGSQALDLERMRVIWARKGRVAMTAVITTPAELWGPPCPRAPASALPPSPSTPGNGGMAVDGEEARGSAQP